MNNFDSHSKPLESDKDKEIRDKIRKIFREKATIKEYKKGTFIFYTGEYPEAVYFIEKGLVKVCQSTIQGEDVTFFLRKRNEVFGYAEVVLDEIRSRYAQCLDHSLIWVLSAREFLHEISMDPEMKNGVLRITNRRLLEQQQMVEMIISQPVFKRLAWLLKEMSVKQEDGSFLVETALTHSELSNIIGCSRQTVSEILSRWRENGYIDYDRKSITIYDFKATFKE